MKEAVTLTGLHCVSCDHGRQKAFPDLQTLQHTCGVGLLSHLWQGKGDACPAPLSSQQVQAPS